MKKPLIVAAVITGMFIVFSCTKDSGTSGNATCTGTKSFTTDALPAIQTYCSTNSSCHATGSSAGPGALTTYSQIYNNRTAISQSISTGSMPKGSALPTAAYNNILCWISQGAANN